jgi:hypothetical protein
MGTISSKQDRTYVRTAQDIERKYSFGKTFGEMLGLINDNRDKVNSVESSLRNEIKESSTTLKRDTEKIVMEAKETIGGVESRVGKLELDADGVKITVNGIVENGVDRVDTKTGYKFDSDGLNITKSGSEFSSVINNEGMFVTKSGNNVLVADKNGVEATDLHAKTFLIIGANEGRSRLEDYGIDRTAIFWIGG